MKILFFSFILMTASAFAHDLDYGPYLQMQEPLSEDNFKGALDAHKIICDKELIHYKDDYKDCDKSFKNIEDLRSSFKTLSNVYFENGKKEELKQLVKVYCPMAKAKWVQKNGKLANPYLGKSMPDCGEKI